MKFFLVLIDSCCSAVMTINLQVFPGFCQILDARAVHWWACVQMLDTGVWSGKCSKLPDNATRTVCRYMYLSCRVWLSHACFFHCKMPYTIFRVYSEWQWILSGVLCLNPSKKWGDYKLTQYQILQTNITRTVWQTVRRIANEILGVKGLSAIWWNKLKKEPIHS